MGCSVKSRIRRTLTGRSYVEDLVRIRPRQTQHVSYLYNGHLGLRRLFGEELPTSDIQMMSSRTESTSANETMQIRCIVVGSHTQTTFSPTKEFFIIHRIQSSYYFTFKMLGLSWYSSTIGGSNRDIRCRHRQSYTVYIQLINGLTCRTHLEHV